VHRFADLPDRAYAWTLANTSNLDPTRTRTIDRVLQWQLIQKLAS
jgi:hypothetical protein